MELKVDMLPEFVAFCDQEKTTAEAVLRGFMRDVLTVYAGKQEPSDTPIGVVQAYAWSYFVRVTNPERCFQAGDRAGRCRPVARCRATNTAV